MKISSRLLLALLPTVAGIMALYAAWAVRQREALLIEQSEAEARVFSTAVGIAFSHAFRDLQYQDVRDILTEIDQEPGIYGVVFYDSEGVPAIRSASLQDDDLAPADAVLSALRGDSALVLAYQVDAERVQSVLRPVRDREGRVTGVLEVVQPLSFVEGDSVRTARRFVLNTVTLLLALATILTLLVRRHVGQPLGEFVAAIRDLREGELTRRLDEDRPGSELAEVAREFNRMVDRLAAATVEMERETDERVALEKRVREQEHLAALGTLAAGVAHQIATPLSVIGGRAEVLLRRGRGVPENAPSLEIIRKETSRITRIVRNLLQFARRPEPEMQPTEVVALVERTLELFRPELTEAGIEVEHVTAGPVWAEADPDLLEEVLVTVLENAVHALREPGAVPRLVIWTEASPGRITLVVKDGGPGIPPDVIGRVFEPFFTTRPGGTGLGLSIAREIVEDLGGTLEVTNALPSTAGSSVPASAAGSDGLGGAAVRISLRSASVVPTDDRRGPVRSGSL